MHKAHDSLFRRTFGHPANAAALLRSLLPKALGRLLDWRTLAPDHGTLVDQHLRRRRTDLLLRIRFKGGGRVMYLLLEHWSRPERFAVLKALGYQVRIWERFLDGHPRCRRLPAVMTVFVHNGPRRWTCPTTLLPLIDVVGLPAEARKVLRPHIPDFRVMLDDLARQGAAGIRERDLPALLQLTFLCMQGVRRRRPAEVLRGLVKAGDLVRKVLRRRGGKEAMDTLWWYVGEASGLDREQLQELVGREFGPAAEASFMNIWQQAKAEGKAEGKAEMLLLQLRLRFGRVPETVASKVRRASNPQLDRWAERLVTARNLTELFGRSRPVRTVRRAHTGRN